MKIFVETERLFLREIVPTDDEAMFELDSNQEVHQYLGKQPLQSIEECRQIIAFIREQYQTHGIGRWAVVKKDTQAFIGWSGLKLITQPINHHLHYYDLGYRFIRKYWGNGYAVESARAVVAYGFETLQLKEIYGMAETANLASQKVLMKAGLQYMESFTWQGEQIAWYKASYPG
jgi:RimJ/RimL family protein N-acetyltransferase